MKEQMTVHVIENVVFKFSNEFYEGAGHIIFLFFYYNCRIRSCHNDSDNVTDAMKKHSFKVTESMIMSNSSNCSAVLNRIATIEGKLAKPFEEFQNRRLYQLNAKREVGNLSPLLNRRSSVHKYDEMINSTMIKNENSKKSSSKKSTNKVSRPHSPVKHVDPFADQRVKAPEV